MKTLLTILLLFLSLEVFSQGRNAVWCFGDSAGIKFTTAGIVGITSVLQSIEASASISDTAGNLIFYSGRRLGGPFYSTVFNNQNQIVLNGDSLISASSATQGLLILPAETNPNEYLLFSIGFIPSVFPKVSLFLTKIDMSQNGGAGAVILKNHVIDSTINNTEKMIAIKHGNGQDWWLINHENNSDLFILRLIHNDTIVSTIYQNIGSYFNSIDSPGQMVANLNGSIISIVGQAGTINVFDFDRCTGVLSNHIDMSDNPLSFDRYYGASISTQNFLYYSTFDSIWQIDLNDVYPIQTKVLVYADQNGNACMGQHQLGPDSKIYITNALPCGYPSTITDSLNTHLTVINQPDSSGLACNVLPYYQQIGGIRSYLGLPNIPNYDLGVLPGSPCDSLTSTGEIEDLPLQLSVSPNPSTSNSITIKYSLEQNTTGVIKIFDTKGKVVYSYSLSPWSSYQNLTLPNLTSGIYLLRFESGDRNRMVKFVRY